MSTGNVQLSDTFGESILIWVNPKVLPELFPTDISSGHPISGAIKSCTKIVWVQVAEAAQSSMTNQTTSKVLALYTPRLMLAGYMLPVGVTSLTGPPPILYDINVILQEEVGVGVMTVASHEASTCTNTPLGQVMARLTFLGWVPPPDFLTGNG
jgi:hypothetical protein